jgi:hypothetical protein
MREWRPAYKEIIKIGSAGPYEPLMPHPEMAYRIFASAGVSLVSDQPASEAALLAESPRNRIRPMCAALDTNSRRRSGDEFALAISQALFVALTAALFIAWLTIAR